MFELICFTLFFSYEMVPFSKKLSTLFERNSCHLSPACFLQTNVQSRIIVWRFAYRYSALLFSLKKTRPMLINKGMGTNKFWGSAFQSSSTVQIIKSKTKNMDIYFLVLLGIVCRLGITRNRRARKTYKQLKDMRSGICEGQSKFPQFAVSNTRSKSKKQ